MNRILVFGITDIAGGVESVIMNYYRNIDKNKFNFDFLCNTEKVAYEQEINNLGGKIYKVTARSISLKKYRKELKDFFENHHKEYSTIWVNVCSLANIDYLKYAKKYGIKYRIIHAHNSKNMDSKIRGILHRINKKFIAKYATDFWTCSEEAGKWFYNKKIMLSNKYLLINNAIDIEKFKYNGIIRERKRRILKLENNLVIGHIGRFHFQKNHNFLIEIFNEIVKQNNSARLLLIGTGTMENQIKTKVKDMNLENKVLFLGEIDNVNEIIQAMDIFLFPSLFEGLALSLIEVQTAGIPILASENAIPKNINMFENCKLLSLQENAKIWADTVLNMNKKNRSQENIEIIKKNGFDIKIETNKIEKYFERN